MTLVVVGFAVRAGLLEQEIVTGLLDVYAADTLCVVRYRGRPLLVGHIPSVIRDARSHFPRNGLRQLDIGITIGRSR
jgi:hypothetical protein